MISFNDKELLSLRKNLYMYSFLCEKFGYPFSKTLVRVLNKLDCYYICKSLKEECSSDNEAKS